MTDNEKLIEEAAKAIYENERRTIDPGWPAWEDCRDGSKESVLDAARDALAVFAKAHTPTDDERGARDAKLLDRITQIIEEDVSISVYAGQANIANPRGVSIKLLSALRRSEVPEPIAGCSQCHRPDGLHKLGCGERFGAEPQGEPSDAQVEHMRRALNAADIDYSAREQRADAGGGDMEPGDWLTFLASAALRAVPAVTEQGERR